MLCSVYRLLSTLCRHTVPVASTLGTEEKEAGALASRSCCLICPKTILSAETPALKESQKRPCMIALPEFRATRQAGHLEGAMPFLARPSTTPS